MQKKYWLMKTEAETFSFDDLVSRPSRTDRWEGVRNYQARNFMRDGFAQNDEVFIYHSSSAEPAIVGVAKVLGPGYPDPTALDSRSPYFDPKSKVLGESRWVMVDVQATGRFEAPITLSQLREDSAAALNDLPLLRPGQRLSIQPVSEKAWLYICGLRKLQKL